MAKKKLIFDPNEDPGAGYEKWTQELLRISNEPVSSRSMEQEKEARSNMRYFGKKMKEVKPETIEAEISPTERVPSKFKLKKKPWPGWGEVLKKL